jgi:hypothetical protein
MTNSEWNAVLAQPGQMPEGDLRWLIQTAAAAPSWTEVGVFAGRSALAVGLSLPKGGRLQLVDICFRPAFAAAVGFLVSVRPGLVLTIMQATSVEAAKVLPDTDVVFIDDDHSYQGARASITAWKNKCRVLCGHDHPRDRDYPPHDGVRRAANEACENIAPVEGSGLWLRVESETA